MEAVRLAGKERVRRLLGMPFRSRTSMHAAISSACNAEQGIQRGGSGSDESSAVLRVCRAAASAACCSGVTPVKVRPL